MDRFDHLSPSADNLHFYSYFLYAYNLLIHIPAQYGSQKHNHQAHSYDHSRPTRPLRPPLTPDQSKKPQR